MNWVENACVGSLVVLFAVTSGMLAYDIWKARQERMNEEEE